jgi:uncharacterized protein YqjF (DUF2071 family)
MTLSPTAPPLTRPVLFRQDWRDLVFLHWALDPATVAPLLPAGTQPDTRDGVTYVGLVAFRMADVAIGGFPAMPYLGDFLETNVRLYTVDREGHRGVYFLSLDATRLITVLAARVGYGVRYTWSRTRLRSDGPHRHYRTRRRWPHPGRTSNLSLTIGDTVEPTPLEVFLTARWGMHSRYAGRTIWTPNSHPPWVLHAATLDRLDDQLVTTAGLRVDTAPDLRPLWSPGVHAVFGTPSIVR